MGCKVSKLEDQEAVALCRGRVDLLAAAVRHRYALADSHGALADSLESLAAPLHRLLLLQASPQLTLPTVRKGGLRSSSSSTSVFLPPGRSAQLDIGSSSADWPVRTVPEQLPLPNYESGPAFAYPAPASTLQFYYARSRPPPASVGVTQRAPGTTQRVRFGSFDSTSSYPQYDAHGGEQATAAPQRSVAPPSSPPRESSWAFLNIFDNYEPYDSYNYDTAAAATVAAYTPSRSSQEVREEEGIPELEDDEEHCVFKEVVSGYSTGSGAHRSRRSSIGGRSSVAERDNPVVDKDVVASNSEMHRRPLAHRNVAMRASPPPAQRVAGHGGNVDVAGEIKTQLLRAAQAARELAPLLEVGKPRYQEHNHASSRLMASISVPNLGCKGVDLVDIRGRVVVAREVSMVDSMSLSLTLEKLYVWERKLYGEVKPWCLVYITYGNNRIMNRVKNRSLQPGKGKRIKILERKALENKKEADELNKKLALLLSQQSLHHPQRIQHMRPTMLKQAACY
ncbi:hypothetical protein GUJ93_ZPchr0014g47505 [Zizania palustris]|uniref:Uncharacterized protein n=1 Tax=Zizania palustris TaxID=103762 RepID=A0A8J5VSK6_ZIZPA|nr:hypothetical protein GUJ93_ZPchr0014g47505 [Zizania palustris]